MLPDKLSAESVAVDLGTHIIGRRVLYFPSISSTMLGAREAAASGIEEGAVIIAGEQTAGRGRQGRAWVSSAGGITLSVVLRPTLAELPSLIMVTSLAVCRCIQELTGLSPGIKWPNDVLIGEKKLCGILIENELRGQRVSWSVAGIGMNVNTRLTDFPELREIATSFYQETGRCFSRLEVVRCLLIELDTAYRALKTGVPIFTDWRARLTTLGRKVRIISGQNSIEGVAEDVDRDGTLLLRLLDGTLKRVFAGEVSLRY